MHTGTLDIHLTNTSSFCTYCVGDFTGANDEDACLALDQTFFPGDATITDPAVCSGLCENITGTDVSQ